MGKTWKFGILQLYQYQCASDMEKEWETKKREEDAGLDARDISNNIKMEDRSEPGDGAIRKCLLL